MTVAVAATDVGGVAFADSVDLGASKLVLNGAGVRWRVVFKVYAAGLYLSRKADTLEEVIAALGAKRLRIVMLRKIEADQLSQLFLQGIRQSLRSSETGLLTPTLVQLAQALTAFKQFLPGDVLTIDYDPSVGTVFRAKDQVVSAPLPSSTVFEAAIQIWLSAKPADPQLKEALLGNAVVAAPTSAAN